MNTKYNLLAGGMLLFGMGMTSCSSEELAPATDSQLSQIPVKAVITVADREATRTTLEENKGNLVWEWEIGDVVVATNADGKYKGILTVSELNEENKKSAKFEGNLSLNVADGASQKLNFHYLGKGFDEFAGVNGNFNINVAEQSGKIEDLVKNDVLSSVETYNMAVNTNYIAIPNIELGHLTSVGHFAIELPEGEEVASVVVSGDNFVNSADLNLGAIALENKADAENTKGITVAGESNFYITLIPNDGMKFHFDVVSKAGNTYAADLCYDDTDEAVSFDLQGGMFLRKNLGYAALTPEITDQFKYVLNFDANGGENAPAAMTAPGPGLENQHTFTVPSGKDIKAPHRNLQFLCWMDTPEYKQGETHLYYAEEDYGSNQFTIKAEDKTKTLYANYRQKNVILQITYDFNGGEFKPTVDGVVKEFGKWCKTEYFNPMKEETNVIDLTVGNARVAANGNYHEIVVLPTKENCEFAGWTKEGTTVLKQNGDKTEATEGTDKTSFNEYTDDLVIEVTYVAQWNEDYILNFDTNVAEGITVSNMPETMTKKSYTGEAMFDLKDIKVPTADKGLVFVGWGTSKNEAEYPAREDVSHKSTNKVETLYAIWKQEKPDTNGGSGDMGGFDPTEKKQN